MKKNFLIIIVSVFLLSSSVMADTFDGIDGITAIQKQQLSKIHFAYKQQNNDYEQRIMQYNAEKAKLKNNTEKSDSDKALLNASYDKSIQTLKEQQAKLEESTDALYKSVLNEAQYVQYKAQQTQTENAFNNFLKK